MIDIKVRYYTKEKNGMTAKFSHPALPRIGEKIRLGEEGDRVEYYIHDVSHQPHSTTDQDVYVICRLDKPRTTVAAY